MHPQKYNVGVLSHAHNTAHLGNGAQEGGDAAECVNSNRRAEDVDEVTHPEKVVGAGVQVGNGAEEEEAGGDRVLSRLPPISACT